MSKTRWKSGLLGMVGPLGLALAMVSAPAPVVGADPGEGFRLSLTCAGCHGTDGAAPGETIPILGGQRADYLRAALADYKSGTRDFYVMNFIARAYSDDQIGAIADWFAAKPWVDTPTRTRAIGISGGAGETCAECHGEGGGGSGKGPRIAGQPAAYLLEAMMAYKAGTRGGDGGAAMKVLAEVGDGEIEDLAHHYAGLR